MELLGGGPANSGIVPAKQVEAELVQGRAIYAREFYLQENLPAVGNLNQVVNLLGIGRRDGGCPSGFLGSALPRQHHVLRIAAEFDLRGRKRGLALRD